MSRSHRPAVTPAIPPAADLRALPGLLLAWYDRHRRDLPWRAKPGERPDPYRVWLSEIMLQQTTVATVAGYFGRFMARWPDIAALAAASLDEVLHAWQGLGYYARARNLHACARAVVERHGGRFPDTETALAALPGIGAYTAAAVAAIAFDRPAAPVDGNVERVMARLFARGETLPGSKPELRRLAALLTPSSRAGDYAQAVMDLGATICTPKKPKCALCPWCEACAGRARGIAEHLPARAAKAAKPLRRGVAFWVVRGDGTVLLRKRPEKGLLGGMMEVPSTPWRVAPWAEADAKALAPVRAKWGLLPGVVRHTFTHFHLELAVLVGKTRAKADSAGGRWVKIGELAAQAMPTLMKKVVAHARGAPPLNPVTPCGKSTSPRRGWRRSAADRRIRRCGEDRIPPAPRPAVRRRG
jgi:A/G-specific adenine glycosylase